MVENADGRTQVLVEFVPEDRLDADPALIGAVAEETIIQLRADGHEIKPVYTGARGGPELFQVLVSSAQTAGTFVMAHKDVLEVVSTIAGLISTASAVVKSVFRAWGKQTAKTGAPETPFVVTLEIEGHAVPVQAKDVEGAEEIVHLAERFYASHPQKVTARSGVKVKAHVPRKQTRRRR